MIAIAGAARRSYAFPAPLEEAFRFNADLDRMLRLLPHIEQIGAPTGETRRLCYSATESRLYEVHVYCTVRAIADARTHTIRIEPLDDPTRGGAGFRSMRGPGRYSSMIRFHAEGTHTRVDYALELEATLPTPGSLRLLPASFLGLRAGHIFHARLDEILGEFVRRSIAEYRKSAPSRARDSG